MKIINTHDTTIYCKRKVGSKGQSGSADDLLPTGRPFLCYYPKVLDSPSHSENKGFGMRDFSEPWIKQPKVWLPSTCPTFNLDVMKLKLATETDNWSYGVILLTQCL